MNIYCAGAKIDPATTFLRDCKQAIDTLGLTYVLHLCRHPNIADSIEGIRTLQADCLAKGIVSRATAYGQILKALEEEQARHPAVAQPQEPQDTYTVTYSDSDMTSMEEHSLIQTLDTEEVELAKIILACKVFTCQAEMFDAAGFRRGWVHADGTYQLQ